MGKLTLTLPFMPAPLLQRLYTFLKMLHLVLACGIYVQFNHQHPHIQNCVDSSVLTWFLQSEFILPVVGGIPQPPAFRKGLQAMSSLPCARLRMSAAWVFERRSAGCKSRGTLSFSQNILDAAPVISSLEPRRSPLTHLRVHWTFSSSGKYLLALYSLRYLRMSPITFLLTTTSLILTLEGKSLIVWDNCAIVFSHQISLGSMWSAWFFFSLHVTWFFFLKT